MNATKRLGSALKTVVPLLLLISFAGAGAGGAEKERPPALGGYCPVAYLLDAKAVKGDAQYKSLYAGRLYHFSSSKAKKLFEESPEKYLPQFDGLCTMALGGPYGNRFQGDPQVFVLFEGKVYLFSSERAKRNYQTNPQSIIENAKRRFSHPLLRGYCPVSYHTQEKAVKGDAKYAVAYDGYVYHLASAEAKKRFVENPAKYAPQYLGYCTVGISRNVRRLARPGLFRVYGNKTYVFGDEQARKEFEDDPAAVVKKADANWKTLKKLK